MLFSDPKWGSGCLALIIGVAGFYLVGTLLGILLNYLGWTIPRPVGSVIGLLICLGIARFILNQIFD